MRDRRCLRPVQPSGSGGGGETRVLPVNDRTAATTPAHEALRRHDWARARDLFLATVSDEPLTADDSYGLAKADWWLGLVQDALTAYEQAYFGNLGEQRQDRAALAAFDVAGSLFLRRDHVQGSGWMSRFNRLLTELPDGLVHDYARFVELDAGADGVDVDDALAQIRQLRAAGERHADVTLCALALMLELYSGPPLARLQARRDTDGNEAGETLQRAWRRALHQKSLLGLAFAGTALVEWSWLHTRPDLARQVIEEWLPHAGRPTAAPVTGELLSFARLAGVTMPDHLDATEPWASALRGEWVAAARVWWALGDSYQRALCLWQAGDVAHGLIALGLLDDLGAHAPARLMRDDLRSRGVRTVPRGPQSRTRDNPAGLTDRQLDVLRLAARGHTNQQIADELVLSVRTVEHHMSTVLAKFGVSTRQEAAEIAASWGAPQGLDGASAG